MANRSRLTLVAFLVLVVGGGILIGRFLGPDAWFAALRKPPFNPPSWVFAPVWTVLYVLIAVAAWRISRTAASPVRTTALAIWWAQLVLNFAWTPLFFGAHRIDLALATIVLLIAAICAFIATAVRIDRIAALLFVPYAAWVAFATALTYSMFRLN
jgi:benzodiazapine receptor